MNFFIKLLKYLLLGFIQGVSEILPISSSGHLLLAQSLMKINTNQVAVFTVLLHFASLLALLIYFRKIIIKMIKGIFLYVFRRKKEYKDDFMLFIYLIVGSIPVAIVGIFLEDKIDSLFSNLLFVGISFIFTAFVLLLLSNLKNGTQEQVTLKSAIITGLFQLIGVFPGISRSGMTLTGAKVSKLEHQKAKEFAFLLFIPVAFGSFIFSLDDAYLLFKAHQDLLGFAFAAMVVTFIMTYLSLHLILSKLQPKHFKYFSIYLVFIGVFTICYALI